MQASAAPSWRRRGEIHNCRRCATDVLLPRCVQTCMLQSMVVPVFGGSRVKFSSGSSVKGGCGGRPPVKGGCSGRPSVKGGRSGRRRRFVPAVWLHFFLTSLDVVPYPPTLCSIPRASLPLLQDLLYTTVLASVMGFTHPAKKLSKQRPPERLMSLGIWLPVMLQFLTCALFQVRGKGGPWRVRAAEGLRHCSEQQSSSCTLLPGLDASPFSRR